MDPFDAPTFDSQKTKAPSSLPLIPESLYGQFGKYRILDKIGQGGMGAVYRAIDTILQREVAIKVPLFGMHDRAATLGRFSREAIAAATLRHPAICPIFEFNEFSGIPYIVTPFLQGRNLHEHLEEDGIWSVERSLRLGITLASGLQEAHIKNIVHRDIKPQNIFLEQSGAPLILDFGLAKVSLASQQLQQFTQAGEVLGTPTFMPPEQIDSGLGPMGPASDIYGLGMTLFRMMTGRTAFVGEATYIIPQILMDLPRAPSDVLPNRPELRHIDALIFRSLEKLPSNRYPTMDAFASEMQKILYQFDEMGTVKTSYLPDLRIVGSGHCYKPSPFQKSIRIGRQRTQGNSTGAIANDLVLRAEGKQEHSLRISRHHLEITADQDGMSVVDRSQAGITINGKAAKKGVAESIRPGDILNVAGVVEIEILPPAQRESIVSQPPNMNAFFEATIGDFYRDAPT